MNTPDARARLGVPHARLAVVAARRDDAAVGRGGERVEARRVAIELAEARAGVGVPDSGSRVVRRRREAVCRAEELVVVCVSRVGVGEVRRAVFWCVSVLRVCCRTKKVAMR